MCAQTLSNPLPCPLPLSRFFFKFRTLLPPNINIQDPRNIQKARKLGNLLPKYLNNLTVPKAKPKSTQISHQALLSAIKSKQLKNFKYQNSEPASNENSRPLAINKLIPRSIGHLLRLSISINQRKQLMTSSFCPTIINLLHRSPSLCEFSMQLINSKVTGQQDIVNNEEFMRIIGEVRRLVYLKKLHIEIQDSQKVSDQGLLALSGLFGKLKNLKDFSFHMIRNSRMTDFSLAMLFGSLWKLCGLRKLSIDLTGSYKVENHSVCMLTESIQRLKKLETFSVYFDGCQIDYENTVKFIEGIAKLEALEALELSLGVLNKRRIAAVSSGNSPEEGLKIGNTLASLRNLKKVSIALDESWATGDELIWDLAWALPQLRHLVGLSLRISSKSWSGIVNDINVRMLCRAISRLQRSLKSLELDLQWSKSITDNGITSLADSISLLRGLEELKLNFGEWNKITDRGILNLSRGISNLEKLEKLSLKLNGMFLIGDEAIKKLSEGFGNLSELNKVDLNFERCCRITKKSVERIGRSVGSLEGFKELAINFNGCVELEGNEITRILHKNSPSRIVQLAKVSDNNVVLKYKSRSYENLDQYYPRDEEDQGVKKNVRVKMLLF